MPSTTAKVVVVILIGCAIVVSVTIWLRKPASPVVEVTGPFETEILMNEGDVHVFKFPNDRVLAVRCKGHRLSWDERPYIKREDNADAGPFRMHVLRIDEWGIILVAMEDGTQSLSVKIAVSKEAV